MRILQLTPRLPWPPRDGGRVAMLQIARGLTGAGATVEVLSLNPRKHHSRVEDARAAMAPATVDAIDIDTSAILGPMRRALTGGPPFLVGRFVSEDFSSALRERLRRGHWDVVHIESPFLLPYLEIIRAETNALVAMRAQNVEFRIWEGLAANSRGPLRLMLRRVARSLRIWEIARTAKCDALVAISESDASDFRDGGCRVPALVLPCAIDLPAAPPEGNPDSFCFIGSMPYRPNQEAVRWICCELWPLVRRIEPRARLTIAGSAFPPALRSLAESAGIPVVADFEDFATFCAPFGAMIAPLFSGSGMRVKVLGAMALGKPVIATTMGAGGIDAAPGREILIADDAAAFAELIARCVREPDFARAIGAAGRALVGRAYDPGTLGRRLVGFYAGLSRSAS